MLVSVGLCVADMSVIDAFNATCGKSRLRGGTIIGGVLAGIGEFPWMVSLQLEKRNHSYKHFCGGVIIGNNNLVIH